jgi:hypothetical protein
MNFSTHFRAAQGLAPVADALSGTVYSDVVRCDGGKVIFILQRGVGVTGKSTITVEACKDVTPTASEAIPFRYKTIADDDAEGALTEASADGYTMTAGSNRIDIIEVDPEYLATKGYAYCRLKAAEQVDSPVLAGILALIEKHTHVQDQMSSPLV